jgi:type VI secretion system protein ImpK
MTSQFCELVHPVIASALDLKDRLDNNEKPDLDVEHRRLLERLRSAGDVRQQSDYAGDGTVFLGARYALACWIDELFIVHSPWADLWKDRSFEVALYGTRLRAEKFWDQADLVLRRPNSPRAPIAPGLDAMETFFLCIVLGFRGKYRQDARKVREYVEEMRPQVTVTTPWPKPAERGVKTNVEPLFGRARLRRVIAIYGSLVVVVSFVLFVLRQILR